MNAYIAGVKDDDDAGNELIFAKTAKEAKKIAWTTDLADNADSFIDIYVKRYPEFDGMENATKEELALKKWYEGFFWLDRTGMPDCDTATDEEFLYWWKAGAAHEQ